MRLNESNEKLDWRFDDEIGELIRQYNDMVDKLEETAVELATSERESAWKEMAQQVAHEIKIVDANAPTLQMMEREKDINEVEMASNLLEGLKFDTYRRGIFSFCRPALQLEQLDIAAQIW